MHRNSSTAVKTGGHRLFLCGDVMTGRGVDQILQCPSDPVLYETHVLSALAYVELAEEASGAIPRPVDPPYVWGDALAEIERRGPHARIINLETSVTTSPEAVPKGINYRMRPANVGCLSAARIDCCVLANNHVMDWGVSGLLETVATLQGAGIAITGAGLTDTEARQPAGLQTGAEGKVLVFGRGSPTSGIPLDWAAGPDQPGISIVSDVGPATARALGAEVLQQRREGDVAVVSIHWGENWGYAIPPDQREFAHGLIESGGVDVIHGHSSHHLKGVEVYRGKLILYGCGDFIDDYEGIWGHEEYRPDLAVAYFVWLEANSGRLERLEMLPFRRRRMRLETASAADVEWLRDLLNREGRTLGTHAEIVTPGSLELRW